MSGQPGQPGQLQPPAPTTGPPQMLVQVGHTLQTVALTTGPIPPPEQLAAYDQIVPGAANRMLTMAETEQRNRTAIVSAQIRQSDRAQWLAFALALCFLGACVCVTLAGWPWVGGILGGSTVVGVVTIFITGQAQQKPAAQEKPPGT
jgi:uncharacterized membrane protein